MAHSAASAAVAEALQVRPGRYPAPVQERAVRQDWQAQGFTCQLWVDPPGQEWTDFVHETRELVTVLEGRLEFQAQGRSVLLDPGDELLLPRRVRHTVKNVFGGTARWLFGYG